MFIHAILHNLLIRKTPITPDFSFRRLLVQVSLYFPQRDFSKVSDTSLAQPKELPGAASFTVKNNQRCSEPKSGGLASTLRLSRINMNQGNSAKGPTEKKKNQFLQDFILIQDIYRQGQITFEVIILGITSPRERKSQSHEGTVNCTENHSLNSIPAQL